ncbi:HupE/UreJ family protein [Aestuariivirga sp.]|uniref:HupE/UreJ family protein n=1 Tax=Aestuariivirga sp. TaxID=2650926 RepID=UPI003BAACBB2
MARYSIRALSFAGAMLVMTGLAHAHTGAGDASGFVHGFSHPFSGLDHILAMVAVGLYAAQRGGRALWLVPLAFVGMMAVGGVLGVYGVNLPLVELGIAASVIVLGAAVAFEVRLPTAAALGLVGFFAIFHGHAHGAEMPADAAGLSFAAGFMIATAMLHGLGVGLGLATGSLAHGRFDRVVRYTGGAMSLAGIGILAGVL